MFKPVFIFLLSILITSCTGSRNENIPTQSESIIKTKRFKLPALPESIHFCGVDYPLDNFDVRERLDKEIIVNTFYHSSTIQIIKRANRYFSGIEKVLSENNVPDDMKYLCVIESALTQAVSRSGAKGFWQFMPATGKEYGLIINREVDERLNIDKSTVAACEYLQDANERFNDWLLTAASYNRGVGGISRDLEMQQVKSYFDLHLNNETSRYVFRIFALKLILENPEAYGFYPDDLELYDPIRTNTVKVNSSIEDLIAWAKDHNSNYHMIKVLNPWLISDKLTVKKNQEYSIQLPIY